MKCSVYQPYFKVHTSGRMALARRTGSKGSRRWKRHVTPAATRSHGQVQDTWGSPKTRGWSSSFSASLNPRSCVVDRWIILVDNETVISDNYLFLDDTMYIYVSLFVLSYGHLSGVGTNDGYSSWFPAWFRCTLHPKGSILEYMLFISVINLNWRLVFFHSLARARM